MVNYMSKRETIFDVCERMGYSNPLKFIEEYWRVFTEEEKTMMRKYGVQPISAYPDYTLTKENQLHQ